MVGPPSGGVNRNDRPASRLARQLRPLAIAGLCLLSPLTTSSATSGGPWSPGVRLIDVSAASGITFRHHAAHSAEKQLPETMGAGVALLDFDGDDDLDIYFVQSGAVRPGGNPAERRPPSTTMFSPVRKLPALGEAIFDGLKSRFTYATTGERIYMDFQLGGVRMGQRANLFNEDTLNCAVTIAAPAPIAFSELLMVDWGSGEYSPVKRWEKPGKLIDEKFDFPNDPFGAMYYLRVELVDKVRERPVRAWSSPIWIDP